MEIISTNPANGYSRVGSVPITNSEEVSRVVSGAAAAKTRWKEIGLEKRIELLRPICDELEQRKEEIAQLITSEIGKPITQTRSEASGYVDEFRWFLDNATSALKPEVTYEDENSIHKIVYEPYGVAAVISPWNFPFGMAIWGIVPNLIAGNTVVFKISEECPLVGKLVEKAFSNHDLPTGVFSEVYGAGDVGRQLSEAEGIDLIWFTGSTRTGKSLYKTAAEKFIKPILEMGGSNPCIVFEDADIKTAASLIYSGRFQNCGQVCDATKRLIVHESIKDKIIEALEAELTMKKLGDPTDPSTDIGSLAAERQLDLIKKQAEDSMSQGAEVAVKIEVPADLEGAFYPLLILDKVDTDMRIWREEVFGPVLPVISFKTEEEAIALANDTVYGLGSRVISADKQRAERVASKIDSGTVEVNEGDRWLSCNPFGGYKDSGMGREHGVMGFRELCQVKVISSSK